MNNTFNIMVLGKFHSGKSSLIIRFITNQFVQKYDQIVDDSYQKQITINGNVVLLEILDYEDSGEFNALRDQYMRKIDGFIIVHPINSKYLIEDVEELYEMIYRVMDISYDQHFPIVIVGSKNDLENERIINKQEVEDFAINKGIVYIECSAKTGDNVQYVFETLTKDIYDTKQTINKEYNEHENLKKQKGCCII